MRRPIPGAAAIERRFKRVELLCWPARSRAQAVVRIHDLGDVDGMKYITMPYVQGADLSTVPGQAGRLSVQRTLAYTRQIVDGLVAAHAAGWSTATSPANIMIDEDDQALIMDFGIARSSDGPPARCGASSAPWPTWRPNRRRETDRSARGHTRSAGCSPMLVGRRRPTTRTRSPS
jgi:serine/threonine-protein kinase